MKAYLYDDLPGDPREDHDSGTQVSESELQKIGIHYWHTDLDGVNKIAKERNYECRDEVNITPDSFGGQEKYEEKLKTFFTEHLHEDEEIRYILDGEGFFDARDAQDRWVRLKVTQGDLLIMPAGIYHRFILTTTDYVKAMRLFQTEPKWIPHNRPAEDNKYRQEYVSEFISKGVTA